MPGSLLGDWLLRPVFEAVLQVLGYWTGRVVVPLLSLCSVRVEPLGVERPGTPRRARPRWHGVQRAAGGGFAIDEDMTMLLGLLFWVVVGAGGYLLYRLLA